MQDLNNQNEMRQRTGSNNKKIFIIICIYLFLTLTSKYSKNEGNNQTALKQKLLTGADQMTAKDAISPFQLEEVYQGRWQGPGKVDPDGLFSSKEGRFEMRVSHVNSLNSKPTYRIQVSVFNGDYIDNGVLNFFFYLNDEHFSSERENETLSYFYNRTDVTDSADQVEYSLQEILIKTEGGSTELDQAKFSFSLSGKNTLQTELSVQLLKSKFLLTVQGKENSLLRIMMFAGVLFVVSFSAFSSIMAILKALYQLHDNPQNYSLVTICLTCMWDAALCIVAFIYAFSDQESLMLFIMPAFLLCLLFTNLQPRLMILIYQQTTNSGIREIICKFNLFHYGTLFLIYPLLLTTNLGWSLFLLMSCIYFPQIYTNGLKGIRPKLTSPYYTRYLLTRMLIILYLRCFPLNIFHLQPDYLLMVICLLLILLQYSLLYVQKRYGSKKVIPRFLLQPVFNYKDENEINLEQGGDAHECSICLTSLASEPMHDPNELQFQPPFKLMRTPCKHNYHSRCLMLWMKVKMECPQCRYKLPPYE